MNQAPSFLDTFIRLLPDLIREAATSPLGIIALIVLVLSLVIMVLFRRGHVYTLVAFLALLVSLTGLGWQMAVAYPKVERENRELILGPQLYDLSQDTRWNAPNIRIRGGTVVQTNGHAFQIDATKGDLIIEGQATIRSFPPGIKQPTPSDKPTAKPAEDSGEAPQCENGNTGKKGGQGEPGHPGLAGRVAGLIAISAQRAIGSLVIVNTGMDGGQGGRGGDGGLGGTGQRGGRGRGATFDCSCGGAYGGLGGPGGDAGTGGTGGAGGRGGDVSLQISNADQFEVLIDTRGGLSGPSGSPGKPGEPGDGGPGGGGDGPWCRDESNSRRGGHGNERGKVPESIETAPIRADSGHVHNGSTPFKSASGS